MTDQDRLALADELENAATIGPEEDGIGRVITRLLNPEERDLVVSSLRALAQSGGEPVAWREALEIPSVPKGGEREYIVAVYRAHSGKVYSFACTYLNATPLNCDECPLGNEAHSCGKCTDDGCPFTGWYRLTGDDGESGSYQSLHLETGDEIRGWREIPRWEDRAALASAPQPAADNVQE